MARFLPTHSIFLWSLAVVVVILPMALVASSIVERDGKLIATCDRDDGTVFVLGENRSSLSLVLDSGSFSGCGFVVIGCSFMNISITAAATAQLEVVSIMNVTCTSSYSATDGIAACVHFVGPIAGKPSLQSRIELLFISWKPTTIENGVADTPAFALSLVRFEGEVVNLKSFTALWLSLHVPRFVAAGVVSRLSLLDHKQPDSRFTNVSEVVLSSLAGVVDKITRSTTSAGVVYIRWLALPAFTDVGTLRISDIISTTFGLQIAQGSFCDHAVVYSSGLTRVAEILISNVQTFADFSGAPSVSGVGVVFFGSSVIGVGDSSSSRLSLANITCNFSFAGVPSLGPLSNVAVITFVQTVRRLPGGMSFHNITASMTGVRATLPDAVFLRLVRFRDFVGGDVPYGGYIGSDVRSLNLTASSLNVSDGRTENRGTSFNVALLTLSRVQGITTAIVIEGNTLLCDNIVAVADVFVALLLISHSIVNLPGTLRVANNVIQSKSGVRSLSGGAIEISTVWCAHPAAFPPPAPGSSSLARNPPHIENVTDVSIIGNTISVGRVGTVSPNSPTVKICHFFSLLPSPSRLPNGATSIQTLNIRANTLLVSSVALTPSGPTPPLFIHIFLTENQMIDVREISVRGNVVIVSPHRDGQTLISRAPRAHIAVFELMRSTANNSSIQTRNPLMSNATSVLFSQNTVHVGLLERTIFDPAVFISIYIARINGTVDGVSDGFSCSGNAIEIGRGGLDARSVAIAVCSYASATNIPGGVTIVDNSLTANGTISATVTLFLHIFSSETGSLHLTRGMGKFDLQRCNLTLNAPLNVARVRVAVDVGIGVVAMPDRGDLEITGNVLSVDNINNIADGAAAPPSLLISVAVVRILRSADTAGTPEPDFSGLRNMVVSHNTFISTSQLCDNQAGFCRCALVRLTERRSFPVTQLIFRSTTVVFKRPASALAGVAGPNVTAIRTDSLQDVHTVYVARAEADESNGAGVILDTGGEPLPSLAFSGTTVFLMCLRGSTAFLYPQTFFFANYASLFLNVDETRCPATSTTSTAASPTTTTSSTTSAAVYFYNACGGARNTLTLGVQSLGVAIFSLPPNCTLTISSCRADRIVFSTPHRNLTLVVRNLVCSDSTAGGKNSDCVLFSASITGGASSSILIDGVSQKWSGDGAGRRSVVRFADKVAAHSIVISKVIVSVVSISATVGLVQLLPILFEGALTSSGEVGSIVNISNNAFVGSSLSVSNASSADFFFIRFESSSISGFSSLHISSNRIAPGMSVASTSAVGHLALRFISFSYSTSVSSIASAQDAKTNIFIQRNSMNEVAFSGDAGVYNVVCMIEVPHLDDAGHVVISDNSMKQLLATGGHWFFDLFVLQFRSISSANSIRIANFNARSSSVVFGSDSYGVWCAIYFSESILLTGAAAAISIDNVWLGDALKYTSENGGAKIVWMSYALAGTTSFSVTSSGMDASVYSGAAPAAAVVVEITSSLNNLRFITVANCSISSVLVSTSSIAHIRIAELFAGPIDEVTVLDFSGNHISGVFTADNGTVAAIARLKDSVEGSSRSENTLSFAGSAIRGNFTSERGPICLGIMLVDEGVHLSEFHHHELVGAVVDSDSSAGLSYEGNWSNFSILVRCGNASRATTTTVSPTTTVVTSTPTTTTAAITQAPATSTATTETSMEPTTSTPSTASIVPSSTGTALSLTTTTTSNVASTSASTTTQSPFVRRDRTRSHSASLSQSQSASAAARVKSLPLLQNRGVVAANTALFAAGIVSNPASFMATQRIFRLSALALCPHAVPYEAYVEPLTFFENPLGFSFSSVRRGVSVEDVFATHRGSLVGNAVLLVAILAAGWLLVFVMSAQLKCCDAAESVAHDSNQQQQHLDGQPAAASSSSSSCGDLQMRILSAFNIGRRRRLRRAGTAIRQEQQLRMSVRTTDGGDGADADDEVEAGDDLERSSQLPWFIAFFCRRGLSTRFRALCESAGLPGGLLVPAFIIASTTSPAIGTVAAIPLRPLLLESKTFDIVYVALSLAVVVALPLYAAVRIGLWVPVMCRLVPTEEREAEEEQQKRAEAAAEEEEEERRKRAQENAEQFADEDAVTRRKRLKRQAAIRMQAQEQQRRALQLKVREEQEKKRQRWYTLVLECWLDWAPKKAFSAEAQQEQQQRRIRQRLFHRQANRGEGGRSGDGNGVDDDDDDDDQEADEIASILYNVPQRVYDSFFAVFAEGVHVATGMPKLFIPLEFICSIAIGIVSGRGFVCRSRSCCQACISVALFFSASHFFFVMCHLKTVYLCRWDCFVGALSSALTLALTIIIVVLISREGPESDSDMTAIEMLSLAGVFLGLVDMVCAALQYVRALVVNFLATRQEEKAAAATEDAQRVEMEAHEQDMAEQAARRRAATATPASVAAINGGVRQQRGTSIMSNRPSAAPAPVPPSRHRASNPHVPPAMSPPRRRVPAKVLPPTPSDQARYGVALSDLMQRARTQKTSHGNDDDDNDDDAEGQELLGVTTQRRAGNVDEPAQAGDEKERHDFYSGDQLLSVLGQRPTSSSSARAGEAAPAAGAAVRSSHAGDNAVLDALRMAPLSDDDDEEDASEKQGDEEQGNDYTENENEGYMSAAELARIMSTD